MKLKAKCRVPPMFMKRETKVNAYANPFLTFTN